MLGKVPAVFLSRRDFVFLKVESPARKGSGAIFIMTGEKGKNRSRVRSYHNLVVIVSEEKLPGSTRCVVSLRNVFKTSKDLIFASVIFLSKELSNSIS